MLHVGFVSSFTCVCGARVCWLDAGVQVGRINVPMSRETGIGRHDRHRGGAETQVNGCTEAYLDKGRDALQVYMQMVLGDAGKVLAHVGIVFR